MNKFVFSELKKVAYDSKRKVFKRVDISELRRRKEEPNSIVLKSNVDNNVNTGRGIS